MNDKLTSVEYFYGEWTYYDSDEERLEAIDYLAKWVKFFIRRFPNAVVKDTAIVDHPCEIYGIARSTIGCKIFLEHDSVDYDLFDGLMRKLP